MQIPQIGGRVTLIAGDADMASGVDATSSTLWWTPKNSASFPVLDATATWQEATFVSGPTDQIGVALSGGTKWQAGHSYDLFGIMPSPGVGIIGTGPAWPANDFASRNITRYDGVLVSSAPMSIDTSASAAVVAPQYQATWLGSITVSTTGQLTVHFGYGQSRRCEAISAFNRVPRVLRVGDVTIPSGLWQPNQNFPNWQFYANNPANCAYLFTPQPQLVEVDYLQNTYINSNAAGGPAGAVAVILEDGSYVGHGNIGASDLAGVEFSHGGAGATYKNPTSLGNHIIGMGAALVNRFSSSLFGGNPQPSVYSIEGNQVMYVRFEG